MILGAQGWRTNAAMIADVRRLGHLPDAARVVDLTYGKGNWWREYKPQHLVAHDIARNGVDFRTCVGIGDRTYDVVALDPPYVPKGGRKTSTLTDMTARFGMDTVPRTLPEHRAMMEDGIVQAARILKPGGRLLLKCMDSIWSGKVYPSTVYCTEAAWAEGLVLVEKLVHVGHAGPQPPGRREVHARRNESYLLIFKKKGRNPVFRAARPPDPIVSFGDDPEPEPEPPAPVAWPDPPF